MSNGKIKVEKGSVMETLLLPLYGRKLAMDLYPENFHDTECQKLFESVEFETPEMPKVKAKIAAIMAATRQLDLVLTGKEYLKDHPKAVCCNLGCGLDTSFSQLDNQTNRGVNIDFPETIDVRNKLLGQREREINLACNLLDFSWMDKIDYKEEEGGYFFASGVFYYFKREDVKKLFVEMARRFKGSKLVFDATNAKGLKSMAKAWLEPAQMKEVGVYFSLEDEKELLNWSKDFSSVVHKGYLEGYRPLDKRYGWLLNTLFRMLDKRRLCQVIEITF